MEMYYLHYYVKPFRTFHNNGHTGHTFNRSVSWREFCQAFKSLPTLSRDSAT